MSIYFDQNAWTVIKDNYARWWLGELERPLIHLTATGYESDRKPPRYPLELYLSYFDLNIPALEVVDAIDYSLSQQRFLGDAFPCTWLNFGPGVLATAVGDAELFNGTDTVWYKPPAIREISELTFKFDPKEIWYQRIESIAKCAGEFWRGSVQVGITDFGGTLDILSTYRAGEALLYDFYDAPDVLKTRTWEIHEAWWQAFDRLSAVLGQFNPGYTAWTPIFSEEPYYMLQCDIAYMISPEMFTAFVLPELHASCRRLKNAFYHLDGVGQLPHLDALLSIPELKGIQWIPGEGQPDEKHWPEVYNKIRAAGKLVQLFGTLDTLDTVVEQVGSSKGIILIGSIDKKDEASARERVEQYLRA